MEKKFNKIIVIAIIMLLLNAVPSYADEYFYWDGNKITEYSEDSNVLPKGSNFSKDIKYGKPRGTIISTAILEISDEKNGNIGLHIQTLAHVECDQILHALTLQRYNSGTNEWEKVIRFEYDVSKEDNPDEKLTSLSNGVVVKDLPSGTYRARGLHGVYSGDSYESYSTRTSGVEINRW